MRLTGSVPVFSCRDVERCLAFYQSAFQFVILRQRRSEHDVEWVYLASGDCLLMLEKYSGEGDVLAQSSRHYFYTDDASALHHFLKARGYAPGNIRKTDYGLYEFDILDPEGHLLSVGEKI